MKVISRTVIDGVVLTPQEALTVLHALRGIEYELSEIESDLVVELEKIVTLLPNKD